MTDPVLCRLHTALGDAEECPRGWCAFWETDRCTLERTGIDSDANPSLARHLLELREGLERRRDLEYAQLAIDEIDRILPPGLSAA